MLIAAYCPGQQQSPRNLMTGDYVDQTIRLFDSTNSEVTVVIPSRSPMLIYRFRSYNWFTDNKDSIEAAEAIFRHIVTEAPTLKKMRVICYGYNLDNFLTNKSRPYFRADSGYTVEYYFLNNRSASPIVNGGKLVLVNRDGKVLAASAYIGNFKFNYKHTLKQLRAKLLTEKNGRKIPLVNAKVYFYNDVKDTLSSATTNKYGDFELNTPDDRPSATLRVEPVEKNIKTVILATQEGKELSKFTKTGHGFEFKFIHAEMARLTELPEEDISLMVKDFAKANEKEFRKTEDINYDLSSYELDETSKHKLDNLGRALMQNQNIRMEVISHTDSQGDDAKNKELSEKRSISVVSYLVFIGVNKSRLKATGKGESEIRNRCVNGVDCSDAEHRYNRRTEFKFIKE